MSCIIWPLRGQPGPDSIPCRVVTYLKYTESTARIQCQPGEKKKEATWWVRTLSCCPMLGSNRMSSSHETENTKCYVIRIRVKQSFPNHTCPLTLIPQRLEEKYCQHWAKQTFLRKKKSQWEVVATSSLSHAFAAQNRIMGVISITSSYEFNLKCFRLVKPLSIWQVNAKDTGRKGTFILTLQGFKT